MLLLQAALPAKILWIIKLLGPLFEHNPCFCFSGLPQQSAAEQIRKHYFFMAGTLLAINFTRCPQICVLLSGKVSQGGTQLSLFPLNILSFSHHEIK